jgi:tetratricopeptide (TPR) repeat protein
MRTLKAKLLYAIAIGLANLTFSSCGGWWESAASHPPPLPAAVPLPSEDQANKISIRWLEDRVRRDPEDFISHNKLVGYYLQLQRETGAQAYLELASRAARASLAVLPAEQNRGGLTALAQVEYASHDFAAARDHAQLLSQLDPRRSYPLEILGDALLELGDYDKAATIFHRLEELGSGSLGAETRLARLALLRGQTDVAVRRLSRALTLSLKNFPPSRETVAWCRWQLGETAFAVGDYETAERHYRDSLVSFPNYYRALASLGRVRAARGDMSGAIEQYERVTRALPDPVFVAALGDLYHLSGREKNAAAQYALAEQIGKLGAINGVLYNRQLALFYADHDIKVQEAYIAAAKEYAVRRDIHGADAVAWTAFKAGKLAEAQVAIREALRLGTRDARLFYHAGMIALAARDKAAGRHYLERALALSPQFDPMQTLNARKAMGDVSEP